MWNALSGPMAALAVAHPSGAALRLDPDVGVFAAARDTSEDSRAALAELAAAHPGAGLVEREGTPLADVLPHGIPVASRAACAQMVMTAAPPAGGRDAAVERLGPDDAEEMLALALMTRPGPFRRDTHRLGGFVGVRDGGRLVAMAGRRLRVGGFAELSGVCTHPDHRGRGLARALSLTVVDAIRSEGRTPFLHAYADHDATIAFYRGLGFEVRARLTYTVLEG